MCGRGQPLDQAGDELCHEGRGVRFALEQAGGPAAGRHTTRVSAEAALQQGVGADGPGEGLGQAAGFAVGLGLGPVEPSLDLHGGPIGRRRDLERIADALDQAQRRCGLVRAG